MIIMIAAASENLEKTMNWFGVYPTISKVQESHFRTSYYYGAKTFESFPKPLPNRTHIVISRQDNYNPEGCIVVSSMEKAIAICPTDQYTSLVEGIII
jgi:dihydrofolate reductase